MFLRWENFPQERAKMQPHIIFIVGTLFGIGFGFAIAYPKGYEDGKRVGYHRGRSINFKSLTEVK